MTLRLAGLVKINGSRMTNIRKKGRNVQKMKRLNKINPDHNVVICEG